MAPLPPTENSEQTTAPVAGPNGAEATTETADGNTNAAAPPLAEPKLPTRKDASLKEFLNKMDDYAPIVCSPSPNPSAKPFPV
jgi:transcription initiation factor TFIID subunit 10